jgi:hypothetical protein
MSESNGESRAEIKTALGSLSVGGKRMSELIAVFCLCLLFLLAYVLWDHKDATTKDNDKLQVVLEKMAETQTRAIDRMTEAQGDMVRAQREQNCLMSLPAERREKEYFSPTSFCKQISR